MLCLSQTLLVAVIQRLKTMEWLSLHVVLGSIIKKAERQRIDALTVVLEKTLESPLDRKEVQPVHPKWNQSQIFIGRTDAEAETPILWPPDRKKWLIGKDPDAGKIEGGRRREDEIVG